MHWKRRIISLLMASLLAFTFSPLSHAYTDADGTWAAEVIRKATAYGLMEGYPDGRFGVGEDMTRAAFVTVLCRMLSWEEPVSSDVHLPDVSGHWAEGCLNTAASHGLIDPDVPFRPDDPISRMDMAKLLIRALGWDSLAQSLSDAELPFPDVPQDRGYVALAYDFGLVNGVEELGQPRFLPQFSAPREQCAALLVRCYERLSLSTDWLHSFYAFASYPQLSAAASMDAVSVGWAQLQFINGAPLVNSTSAHNNDWARPGNYTVSTDFFAQHGLPCQLNVFSTASAFRSTLDSGGQESLIAQLVAAAQPYSGLTVDFEGLRADSREAYAGFMADLRAALPEDKALWVCVQPDAWFDGYDYRALGEVCGKVILMAHDYQWAEVPRDYLSTPRTYSPVTPIDQVCLALEHITDPVTGVRDRSKIALQIAFGTAGLRVDKNGCLLDRTIYHPTKDTIAKRLAQRDSRRTWDEASRNPYLEYRDEKGRRYKLWYEDAQSVEEKLRLARMFGVTGVSLWRLGNIPDYPDLPNYDVLSLFPEK